MSPRTVYRHFETKEGLVLRDEYDDRFSSALAHFLQQGLTPLDAVKGVFDTVGEDHFVSDAENTRGRIELFFETPSLRAAGYLLVEERVGELAAEMSESTGMSTVRSRAIIGAVVWGIVGALTTWYETDRGPLMPYLSEALDALRDMA